jgi:hypothetical protein
LDDIAIVDGIIMVAFMGDKLMLVERMIVFFRHRGGRAAGGILHHLEALFGILGRLTRRIVQQRHHEKNEFRPMLSTKSITQQVNSFNG